MIMRVNEWIRLAEIKISFANESNLHSRCDCLAGGGRAVTDSELLRVVVAQKHSRRAANPPSSTPANCINKIVFRFTRLKQFFSFCSFHCCFAQSLASNSIKPRTEPTFEFSARIETDSGGYKLQVTLSVTLRSILLYVIVLLSSGRSCWRTKLLSIFNCPRENHKWIKLFSCGKHRRCHWRLLCC